LFLNGKEELAVEVLQKQIALDPSFVVARQALGWVYLWKGKLSEAITELETAHRLAGSGTYGLGELGFAYACGGRTNEAHQVLAELLELPRQGLNYYVSIGAVQHALGDDEAVLDSMEKAFEEHSAGLNALNWGLFWSYLHPHPRAQAILKKMNLVK
jgi:tetratricopeptide (TPR) repeat protein